MKLEFDNKDTEKTPMAPTVSIEQFSIVRQIKIVAILCSMGGVFLSALSIAATTWFKGDKSRAGLWEYCIYLPEREGVIQCESHPSSDWLTACRVLSVLSLIVCFVALITTSVGLTTDVFSRKYRYYVTGMILMFAAGVSEMISLIIYPVKYSEIVHPDASWGMGWAYALGWVAAVLMTVGSVVLYIDKGADELVYRETTNYNDSIEDDC